MATGTHSTAGERAEWLADLRETLPPGSTVHTVLRHVSQSGMSRAIDLYALRCEDGAVSKSWISYRAAAVMGWTFSQRYEALSVSGAGMDMGFHAVYTLSRYLYPDGFDCAGERCRSNDHSNGQRERGAGIRHADGGYALRHEWL
jgi:hypothetical protein